MPGGKVELGIPAVQSGCIGRYPQPPYGIPGDRGDELAVEEIHLAEGIFFPVITEEAQGGSGEDLTGHILYHVSFGVGDSGRRLEDTEFPDPPVLHVHLVQALERAYPQIPAVDARGAERGRK